MSVLAIIILIVLGIFLLIVEFLIAPGVTIAGIGGFVLIIGSIFMAYKYYGTPMGHYVLFGTGVGVILTLTLTLRSKTWNRVMHTKYVEGRASDSLEGIVKPGDEGKTVTRLAPTGNVLVNGQIIEGSSSGDFISENAEIEVTKVYKNKIIVKIKS
ncbi:MAG: NfeD family protein [Bacteroidota bacterium]